MPVATEERRGTASRMWTLRSTKKRASEAKSQISSRRSRLLEGWCCVSQEEGSEQTPSTVSGPTRRRRFLGRFWHPFDEFGSGRGSGWAHPVADSWLWFFGSSNRNHKIPPPRNPNPNPNQPLQPSPAQPACKPGSVRTVCSHARKSLFYGPPRCDLGPFFFDSSSKTRFLQQVKRNNNISTPPDCCSQLTPWTSSCLPVFAS